jgi:hypothetical protein
LVIVIGSFPVFDTRHPTLSSPLDTAAYFFHTSDMEHAFFEDPTYVCAALAIAALAMAAAWYERRRRTWLVGAAAMLVLAAGLVVLERAVVTDRERILLAIDDIAAAVSRGDVDAAGKYVDESFGGWRGSKSVMLAYGRAVLAQYKVRKVAIAGEVEVHLPQPTVAEVKVRTVVHLPEGDHVARSTPIVWETEWIKRPEGWRVRRAQPNVGI